MAQIKVGLCEDVARQSYLDLHINGWQHKRYQQVTAVMM